MELYKTRFYCKPDFLFYLWHLDLYFNILTICILVFINKSIKGTEGQVPPLLIERRSIKGGLSDINRRSLQDYETNHVRRLFLQINLV